MDDQELSDNLCGSDSESSFEELESELYSVLHYNSLSDEIPPDIQDKYNIQRNGESEFLISLKTLSQSSDVGKSMLSVPCSASSEKESYQDLKHSKLDGPKSRDNENVKSVGQEVDTVAKSQDVSVKVSTKISLPTPLSQVPAESHNTEIPPSDVIFISDTNSDSASDVIIEERTLEICSISSSSVECLSDTSVTNNMMLNTVSFDRKPSTIFPPDEGVEENIKIKWREVASPSSWSENMKKFYNRASKRLKYFDCDKIRQEIKDKGTWEINDLDIFPPKNRFVKRCSFCRQVDHLVKNCPKRFSNCSMCGDPGHSATTCPSKMCLNCGKQNGVFVAVCNNCQNEKYKKCDECNQIGHISSNCPDTWRRYHATTSGKLNFKLPVLNENLMCCNCGKCGHLYENCTSLYFSSYPPTSFLVQNSTELKHPSGKRKSFDRFSDSNWRHKKTRWSDEIPRSFHPQDFNSSPPSQYPRGSDQTPGYSRPRYFNSSPPSQKPRWSDQTPGYSRPRYFNSSPPSQKPRWSDQTPENPRPRYFNSTPQSQKQNKNKKKKKSPNFKKNKKRRQNNNNRTI